jgi:DNA-binding PadR family transcriptional regulator
MVSDCVGSVEPLRLYITRDISRDYGLSEMAQSKIVATIPRGFSRFYVLNLLKEKGPMTGKMIIDEAEKQTAGAWKPSPGLIYPLLGRLLANGLIEETRNGKQKITLKGEKALAEYAEMRTDIDRMLRTVTRLGVTGRLVAEDALDRITSLATHLRESFSELSAGPRRSLSKRYVSFLKNELDRFESSAK